MSFWIAGAIVVSSVATQVQSRKAQKKAKRDAEQQAITDEMNSRKAETFADTEGEGIGQLGKISLEVDDELDEDEEIASNVRI